MRSVSFAIQMDRWLIESKCLSPSKPDEFLSQEQINPFSTMMTIKLMAKICLRDKQTARAERLFEFLILCALASEEASTAELSHQSAY